jgi:hypothetical protein
MSNFPFLKVNLSYSAINDCCCLSLFHIGFNFPKGLHLTLGRNFSISEDGIYYLLHRKCSGWYPLFMLYARFMAILQSIFYLISVPFMTIMYTMVVLATILPAMLLWPFHLCSSNLKFKGFYLTCLWLCLTAIGSLITMTARIILLPIQIVVPELTALVFRLDLWGEVLPGFD